jgi:hypothetical protein
VRTKESFSAYLPVNVDVEKEISYSIRLTADALEAPVEEEAFVGYVAVLYGTQVLATLPLYTTAGAERSTFMGAMNDMQDFILKRSVLAGMIFFAVTLIAWITVEAIAARRKKRRWDKYFTNKIQLSPDQLRRNNRKK